MKVKLLIVLGCITLLSGCHALDGKCDYLPANRCGCSSSPFDPSYYNCNCKDYAVSQAIHYPYRCGNCSCVGDTCSNCWECGKNYNFHDFT